MEDNRIEEVTVEAGAVSETSPPRDTKRQVFKYVGIWVAVVALFLVSNTIIKSVAANKTAANNSAASYSAGQPAAYGSGPGASAGAGAGECGGACCDTEGAVAATPGDTQASTVAPVSDLAAIEKAAIDFYAQKTGDREVVAKAKDFGCHHEITITKDGKVAAELSLRNGEFSSLRPW